MRSNVSREICSTMSSVSVHYYLAFTCAELQKRAFLTTLGHAKQRLILSRKASLNDLAWSRSCVREIHLICRCDIAGIENALPRSTIFQRVL